MSKKIDEKPVLPKELAIVADLIKQSEWSGFFSSGFSLETFIQKAEFRGLIGTDCWTDEMLAMALNRYRQHVIAEGVPEDKADLPIQEMAKRLQLDLNHLRRLFYGIAKIKGRHVETPKSETKEPIEKEEIEIEGAEEE